MAAGADESPRGTAAPANECGKGAAAVLSRKNPMKHTAQLEAVAAAALAWNRARLARIAIAKRVPQLLHPQHGTASRALDAARKTEAQAKARLRKACAAADPASLTLEVEACEVFEAVTLLA